MFAYKYKCSILKDCDFLNKECPYQTTASVTLFNPITCMLASLDIKRVPLCAGIYGMLIITRKSKKNNVIFLPKRTLRSFQAVLI